MALVRLSSISKNRYFYGTVFINPLDGVGSPVDITATGTYPSVEGIDITGWPRLSYYVYNGAVTAVGLASALQVNPTAADDTKWVDLVASIAGVVDGIIPLDRVAHRVRLNVTAITSGGIVGLLVGAHS